MAASSGSTAMELEAGEIDVSSIGAVENGGEVVVDLGSVYDGGRGSVGIEEAGVDGNDGSKIPELLAELTVVEEGVQAEELDFVNKEKGDSDVHIDHYGGPVGGVEGVLPHDVFLAAEAAEAVNAVPVNVNGTGAMNAVESDEESDEEEDDDDGEGMVEEDSDPLGESDESSDASSDEEEEELGEVLKDIAQKNHKDGAEELQKMVQREKGGSSDDEDGATEPPRTANEVMDLPPVPQVDAVLEPHQVPLEVGIVSSVLDKQVIVEGVEHQMVLNEGSILWLTEQRLPLGIVDEVFGPVKKPYYVIRYNKATDVPDVASQGVTVGFVQEFANFVLNESELRKKGYDASGQHDEEIDDEEVEFSDDEKEAEAKMLRKEASKQARQSGEGVDSGRGRGRGGRGGRDNFGGRSSRGRGGGRGRFSRSDSMAEVNGTPKEAMVGKGLQRSNSQGSQMYFKDKRSGVEHQPKGQFQPSPDRQNSWSRSPRPDSTYSHASEPRPPITYNDRQTLSYQSPHHEFVSGMRPMQQQLHLSPQRPAIPPQWGPSSSPIHHVEVGNVHQGQPAPYPGSSVRWPHPAAGPGPDAGVHLSSGGGGYQHPEQIFQARVNLVPMSYPHPQQMGMYAPAAPQPVGTGVFIPPPQFTRNPQGNQMQSQAQGSGLMQGSGQPGTDGRGPVGQWHVNGPSMVTGIPCYSNPPQPIYLQPGAVLNPGMIAPGPSNNVYWTNNPGGSGLK